MLQDRGPQRLAQVPGFVECVHESHEGEPFARGKQRVGFLDGGPSLQIVENDFEFDGELG